MKHLHIRPIWWWLVVLVALVIFGIAYSVFYKDWSLLTYSLFGTFIAVLAFVALIAAKKPVLNLIRLCCSFTLRHRRALAFIFAGVVGLRLAMPCPISGNWRGHYTVHLCADHEFIQFEDGYLTYFHGDLNPEIWGTYRKIGWNKYLWEHYPGDKNPTTIRTGWFMMSLDGEGIGHREWCHRDLHFLEAGKMIQKATTNRPARLDEKAEVRREFNH